MAESLDKPLTLQRAGTVRRVDALFRAMSSDYLLREQFVTDPASVFFEYVYGEKLAPDAALPLNHVVYSVMASKNMMQWLRSRASQPASQMQSGGGFLSEFSRAAVQHGDHAVVHALVRNAVTPQTKKFDGALVSEFVRNTLGLSDGTEHSPGGGGTQQSGTHVTEHSTGGGGTRGWVEREREALLLQADGTEHSPGGGGTQQSGTHVTEHSTGGGGTRGWLEAELFGNSYAKVTLEALSQYASKLQRLGLLDSPEG